MSPDKGYGLNQRLELEIRLDESEHRLLEASIRFWNRNPHHQISFPLGELTQLFALLGQNRQERPLPPPQGAPSPLIQGEFVFLSPQEMLEVDPEEKVGLFIGECLFISTSVPERYQVYVLLHLFALRHLNMNPEWVEILRERGLDFDLSQHWTATMLDVLAVGRDFKPQEMDEFLQWRRSVERSEVVRRELLDRVIEQRLSTIYYKRTTHPNQRALWTRQSWGAACYSMAFFAPSEALHSMHELGITKVDLIFHILTRDGGFYPEKMLDLLEILKAHFEDHRYYSRHTPIDLSARTDLLYQAELLTPSVLQRAALLEPVSPGSDSYILKPYASRTLEPLMDRLIYFSRTYLKQLCGKFGINLLQTLQSAGIPNHLLPESINEKEDAGEDGKASGEEEGGKENERSLLETEGGNDPADPAPEYSETPKVFMAAAVQNGSSIIIMTPADNDASLAGKENWIPPQEAHKAEPASSGSTFLNPNKLEQPKPDPKAELMSRVGRLQKRIETKGSTAETTRQLGSLLEQIRKLEEAEQQEQREKNSKKGVLRKRAS